MVAKEKRLGSQCPETQTPSARGRSAKIHPPSASKHEEMGQRVDGNACGDRRIPPGNGYSQHNRHHHQKGSEFNTDSGPMGVDNRCSTCMSSRREDFEDDLVAVKYNVKGVGGARVRGVMMGTMNFTCQDNNGMIHRHRIPGSHFAPGLEVRLFSLQHFAQSKGDTHPLPRGTKESTYEDCVVLQWDHGSTE